jgi:uncharacterized membrane protein YqjE
MIEDLAASPKLTGLLNGLARTSLGALKNRGELFSLELQEEKNHLAEMLVWTVGLLFLGIMGTLLLTATIVLIFPAALRIYVLGGFALLYFIGAALVFSNVKTLLKHQPFPESVNQLQKDALCLDSSR